MTTYTESIKHKALTEIMARLFAGTTVYKDSDIGAYNSVIEPDSIALDKFRSMLCIMARYIRVENFNGLKHYITNTVSEFVRKTGFNYGHVTGSYLTGTWGVRTSELNDILRVIDLPEIINLYNRTGIIYDLPVKVISVNVTSYSVNYVLDPIDPSVNQFDYFRTWRDIESGDMRGLVLNPVSEH